MAVKRLSLALLGGSRIAIDDTPVRFATNAAKAIVVYIAMQQQPVTRSELGSLFFASSDPKQAAANLRRELSNIKRNCGDFFIFERQQIGADFARIDVDALQFAAAAAQGAGAAALALYSGGFLDGFYVRDALEFEEWMLLQRERLRLLAIEAGRERLRSALQLGDWRDALAAAEQLIGIEPLLEEAQQAKMVLLARHGLRLPAIRHYRQFCDLFEAELGVTPSASSRQHYERILRSSVPAANNLPPAMRPIIGRAAEISEVSRLLAHDAVRCVTLQGMGGIGKTRLAHALAAHLLQPPPAGGGALFLDGIYFVDLVAATSAADLLAEIAAVLDIQQRSRDRLVDQLAAWLADRELLLILDNFEQLAADAQVRETLDRLLQAAPLPKLLITSRARLQLAQERVVELGGLALAAAGGGAQTAASELFLNEARRRVNRPFDESEVVAIAEICRLLDGVPLGIEIAAGWTRQLSAAEILARIQRSFDFLATRLRNVPQRHRSLRAAFRHSWQLLDAPLQQIFARLAVFAGSFDEAAAQAIADSDESQLQQLQAKSLLAQQENGRYVMHPLLREFAAEELAAARAQLAERHADYYLRWLPGANDIYLKTGKDGVRVEVINVRAAWELTVAKLRAGVDAPRQLQLLRQAALPLFDYWKMRGWYKEAIERAASALAVAAADVLLQRRLHIALGWMQERVGDYPQALHHFDTAIALAGELVDDELARALEGKAHTLRFMTQPQEAAEIAEQALALYERLGDEPKLAHMLGMAHQIRSHIDPEQRYDRVAQALQLPTYPRYRADLLHYSGMLAIGAGEYDQAVETLRESQRLMQQIGNTPGYASATVNLSVAAYSAEQWSAAIEAATQALALFRRSNQGYGIAIAQRVLAQVKLVNGELDEGWQAMRQVEQQFEEMGHAHGAALASAYVAAAAAELGKAEAVGELRRAVERLQQSQSTALLANYLPLIAVGLRHAGRRLLAVAVACAVSEYGILEHHARRNLDRLLRQLNGEMASADFEQACDDGHALTLAAAVDLLLAQLDGAAA